MQKQISDRATAIDRHILRRGIGGVDHHTTRDLDGVDSLGDDLRGDPHGLVDRDAPGRGVAHPELDRERAIGRDRSPHRADDGEHERRPAVGISAPLIVAAGWSAVTGTR